MSILDTLLESPIIASVKDQEGLSLAISSGVSVISLLYGDLLSIGEITRQAHNAGKIIFIHLDLIEGLAPREITVDYIAANTCADGIISTKQQLLRRAKSLGLTTIQRFFLLDSIAVSNMEKSLEKYRPDFIEVLPGAMPKMIEKIYKKMNCRIIAGGLLSDKEDVMLALTAGAVAVSSTKPVIWAM